MNAIRVLAMAALVMTAQVYAAPVKIVPNTPTTHAGTPAGVGLAAPVGLTPPVVSSASPGLQVTPAKMLSVEVSATNVMVGSPLTVKLHGVGMATDAACGSNIDIVIVSQAPEWMGSSGVTQTSADFTKWPKTQTYVFAHPGQYMVKLGVYAGAPAHCGYQGPGSVPGDLTKIQVVSAVAK